MIGRGSKVLHAKVLFAVFDLVIPLSTAYGESSANFASIPLIIGHSGPI